MLPGLLSLSLIAKLAFSRNDFQLSWISVLFMVKSKVFGMFCIQSYCHVPAGGVSNKPPRAPGSDKTLVRSQVD